MTTREFESNLGLLNPQFFEKVKALLAVLTAQGFDPVIFEDPRLTHVAFDDPERFNWRGKKTRHLSRRVLTRKERQEKHAEGEAVDIVSQSQGVGCRDFQKALRKGARALGLATTKHEPCHVEWREEE